MPVKPKTLCTHSSCHCYALSGSSRCKDHQRQKFEGMDRSRQDSSNYHSARWRKLRKLILREKPLCAECLKDNHTTAASVVDHIIPAKSYGDFWDKNNLQPLCARHHNKKSAREQIGRGVTKEIRK